MNTEREGGTEMQQRERQTESKRDRKGENAAQDRKERGQMQHMGGENSFLSDCGRQTNCLRK